MDVKRIVENKINLSLGKDCQDFSHRNGFYVGTEIEQAIHRAYTKCNERGRCGFDTDKLGIIIFRIPREILEENKIVKDEEGSSKSTNFHDDFQKWKTVVRYYRFLKSSVQMLLSLKARDLVITVIIHLRILHLSSTLKYFDSKMVRNGVYRF